MSPTPVPTAATLAPQVWAEQTFGAAQLGDARRTKRLVTTAAALAAQPQGSLPRQLGDPAALKGAYRLWEHDGVSWAQLLAPHQDQSREAARAEPVVLLVQDATSCNFSAHGATSGLGPIGDGTGRGFHLQSVLAVQPETRLPLGIVAAEPWLRQSAPETESSAQRLKRPRESDVWGRLVEQVGRPPVGTRWVHVADRGADCYSFFTAGARTGTDVLVRLVQNRRVTHADDTPGHLRTLLREVPVRGTRSLTVPARAGRSARQTTVAVSWVEVTLQPPGNSRGLQPRPEPLPLTALRVWEVDPPADSPPLEWLLATTVPVQTVADAWERVDWYTTRWVIEDFHQCLKTGCGAEATQLREVEKLWRRLAILLPIAVRLLQLRALCRTHPEAPPALVADPLTVQLVAARCRGKPAQTVEEFLRQVARLGGHQGRRGDGPPGWRTLWWGWLLVEQLVEGARLAATLGER